MLKTFAHETLTASKWFFRSLKKGDWLWLIVAVMIASATVTVVKQLGETVQQSMLLKASESLGADLVIQSSRPIDEKWQQQTKELGLQTTQSLSLITMAMHEDKSGEQLFQLVQLKGITKPYSLRGKIKPDSLIPFSKLTDDSVWIEPKLLSILQLDAKSQLTIGNKKFRLAGSVQSSNLISPASNFAPQIWMPLDQIEKIGLIGPGSRINYQLSVAGAQNQLKQFKQLIEKQSVPHWQILSAQAPSKDLGNSLDTAWLFLDLSALSAVLVAGMSILIASRFYLSRWKNSMALMRAFGASNAKMVRLFALQLTWIAVFSSLIGVMFGYFITLIIMPFLDDYFSPLVIASPISAMFIGFFSGILVLWTFAWQAFQSAIKTAPIQVLKSVPNQTHHIHWFVSFFLLLLLISLMLNIDSIFWILLGIICVSLLLFVASIFLIKLMLLLQKQSRGWFKIALSNLTKEAGLVQIQLVSVGLVLFVLMLMTFVRQDLLQNWQASLPANTPNAFVINIQPDQKESVDKILSDIPNKTAAAMVRGRLVQINNQALLANKQKNDRARRLLQREANIAVMMSIPKHNEIIEQIDPNQLTAPRVSVEQGIAELFGIKLGDNLHFNIAGQDLNYQVASIRKVKWQSFQLNFFFIIEPVSGRTLPLSYLSNFHLNQNNESKIDISTKLTKQLAQNTPGVMLIDVRQIMRQIQDIMNQATWAVTLLYGFTLLASIGVLFTATLASQQSRIQSWLLLRTLGAKNREIIKIGLTEFAFLGGLAGFFAATLAQTASLLMSVYLLKTEPTINISLWLLSIFLGATLLLAIGLLSQWSYLQQSPQTLKRYIVG
jgi:putative ABC transport system permease protein